ncbi:hypothetical protein AZSI13_32180 [Azospira sp. I13]|uniref:hypothetical protein n=1 Tax=Azospira sp. I13 TaxID=1765050 RepID=UPI000D42B053|nr:hypothetical protein [Azospira sp. I13]GBG03891.1 hypothetical protein AZSI13_32180 [Azospira sp. I13]
MTEDSVLAMRKGSTEAIVVELYNPKTDLAIALTGYTDLKADAVDEDGTKVEIPLVTFQDAAAGHVKLSGWAEGAFTEGLWNLTIRAKNPAGEVVAYPKEGGLLQIEVFP